jgi:hypothetical protein
MTRGWPHREQEEQTAMKALAMDWLRQLRRAAPQRLPALLLLAAAAAYALSTFCAIANFAWAQPIFDQYRLYDLYLSLPFPQNILQLENGHRPVVPALIRLAEIHWLQADQRLQIWLGAGFAFATSLALAWSAWRTQSLPLAARAGGVLIAVLGVLWLANARMLLHGNEMVHAYLVTLCMVCGAACIWRAAQGGAVLWTSLASLSCAAAMFSFGAGVATFVGVCLLAWLQRLDWRVQLIPLAALALCLAVYLYGMPGDDGVRGQLDFRPLDTLAASARWLSSPWIVGWLGLGDSDLYGWAQDFLRADPLPAGMIAVADTVQDATGLRWTRGGAVLVGLLGMTMFGALLLPRLRRSAPAGLLESLALGVCASTLAIAAVIGLGRLNYFVLYPMQVFADRYLLWPSLFWAGLGLLLLHRLAGHPRLLYGALLPVLLLLPLLAWPTHGLWLGWGATVYRNLQQSAASARADAFDARHFSTNGAVDAETTLRTLQRFRDGRLAMYARPGTEWLGQRHSGSVLPAGPILAHPIQLEALADQRDGSPIARFEGWIGSGIRAAQHGGQLVVLDDAGEVVGFAEYSFIEPGADTLRFNLPRKRGFDGYIRHYDAKAGYRLVLLQGLAQDGRLLYQIQQPGGTVNK